jgi:hypothetical protein
MRFYSVINQVNINVSRHTLFGQSVWLMVFNATFNNISVTSWRSVLLVEETRVPEEPHRQSH